jgi:hypothetical protein
LRNSRLCEGVGMTQREPEGGTATAYGRVAAGVWSSKRTSEKSSGGGENACARSAADRR